MIYAVGGWDDVEVVYSGDYGRTHRGTMLCGEAFETQCAIVSDGWTCDGEVCGGTETVIERGTTAPISQTTAPTTVSEDHIIVRQINATKGLSEVSEQSNVTVIEVPPVFVEEGESASEEESEFDVTKPSGELMVLGGVGLLVVICCGVVCAHARKDWSDRKDSETSDGMAHYGDNEASMGGVDPNRYDSQSLL